MKLDFRTLNLDSGTGGASVGQYPRRGRTGVIVFYTRVQHFRRGRGRPPPGSASGRVYANNRVNNELLHDREQPGH